jgi:hypothetical protein
MNSPLRHAAPWLPSLLLLPALATAQIPIGPGTPITPQPLVTFSPDVLLYGTPSGGGANPNSRVQVFGFPQPGATIELQVVGAPANATASFVVGTGWADQQVPGLGRVLVDANGAATYTATTDGNGRATVPLTVPNSAQAGDEFFVQCTTTAGTGAAAELSSAAWFEVGTAAKPIGMTSTLSGTLTVAGALGSTTTPAVSGILSQHWEPRSIGALGHVGLHASSNTIQHQGLWIHDLTVLPTGVSPALPWTSTNFMRVPAGTAERFLLSFTAGGVDFGPYDVPGTLSVVLGDVAASLGPIPALDNNPLAGHHVTLSLHERLVDTDYFAEIDGLGLPNTLAAGLGLSDRHVEAQFKAVAQRLAARMAAWSGDSSFYAPEVPSYAAFLAAERVLLKELTDGLASDKLELHSMIHIGQIQPFDGLWRLALSKFCALLGIEAIGNGIEEAFLEECGDELKQLGKQIDGGKYKKAAKTIGKIMDKVVSTKFAKKLAEKIGKEAAGKILRKIGAKCIPGIGWGLLIANATWTLTEQWLD